ncbi:unnamed protein product [Didymodactylos carnosus]|uniref:Uncharacterized protein n=1 Tax=Didymodactylos carnosus TaxID=1234261 RepID=A0A813NUW7_9BILA|nr:unnamed protein product [Didymodactylos carnosus]CAF0744923.1 unnamed protein product [Didymodactylos carnosus]CAF3493729.1 unnamed protein product [Didymodactylos carnosus]CAF3523590.1 unnamed protein product [Didymodactylos carnosus]
MGVRYRFRREVAPNDEKSSGGVDEAGDYYDDPTESDLTTFSTTVVTSTDNQFDKAKQHAQEALKLAKKLPSMFSY